MSTGLARHVVEQWSAVPLRVQFLFVLAGVLSMAGFTYGGKAVGVPATPGFGGSILAEPGAVGALAVIGIGMAICALVGTIIAGWMRFDAGLWAAACGLAAVTYRAGTVGDLLRQSAPGAQSPAVLVQMAVETGLLYALLGLAWSVLWLLHRQGWLTAEEFTETVEDLPDPLGKRLGAVGLQAAVMAVLMMLFGQTDTKVQALLAVGVASFLGTMAACMLFPVAPSAWFWAGPLIVAVVGYGGTYFSTLPTDDGWRMGRLTAALAPLARALPLDYASAGTMGALLGYWMIRKRVLAKAEG